MQPFFIVNPALSVLDIQDALLEKFSIVQAVQSLLLFGCFDEMKLRVSEEILCEGLWAMADLLNQVENLQQELSTRYFKEQKNGKKRCQALVFNLLSHGNKLKTKA